MAASQCESCLMPYQDLLEMGTYQGGEVSYFSPLPQSRHATLLRAFEEFEQAGGKIVVELGTTRSFVHGGLLGCNEDDPKWWTPDQPMNWDWGAGCFTFMAASCLSRISQELEVHTVDIAASHIKRCQLITEPYRHYLNYYVDTSEHFLRSFPADKKIDLLYMDTGDVFPIEPTALLHLREAKILVERDLMAPCGLILIDDVRNGTSRKFGDRSEYGKAKYSLPYLLENGFEILMDEYQVLLRKK